MLFKLKFWVRINSIHIWGRARIRTKVSYIKATNVANENN